LGVTDLGDVRVRGKEVELEKVDQSGRSEKCGDCERRCGKALDG